MTSARATDSAVSADHTPHERRPMSDQTLSPFEFCLGNLSVALLLFSAATLA